VVAIPLAVDVWLKLPHVDAGAQVQFTPLFWLSLATVATIFAVVLTVMDEGGGVLRVTVIPGWVIVIVAETDLVLSVDRVPVIVTLPPEGTVAGAVYVVGIVLAVEAGLKLPHAEAGVQDQFTTALCGPFVIVTAMPPGAVAPAANEVGGVNPEVKASVTGSVELLLLPHAARRTARDAANKRRTDRRMFTGHLHSQPACSFALCAVELHEPEIRAGFEW